MYRWKTWKRKQNKPSDAKEKMKHFKHDEEEDLQILEETQPDAGGDIMTSPHKLLRSHTRGILTPSAVPQLEVTLHQLRWPQPCYYNLTIPPASRSATSDQ